MIINKIINKPQNEKAKVCAFRQDIIFRSSAPAWNIDKDKEQKRERWDAILPPRELNPVLLDIASIWQCEDDGDDQFINPTEQAFSLACLLIRTAYSEIKEKLPIPYVIADGNGGLRLRWIWNNKELRLSCNAISGEQSYIYHQQDQDYGVDYSINADKLIYWLRWLISA